MHSRGGAPISSEPEGVVQPLGTVTEDFAIDFSEGNQVELTLGASVAVSEITNWPHVAFLQFLVLGGTEAGRRLTFPPSVIWPGGEPEIIPEIGQPAYVTLFTYDGDKSEAEGGPTVYGYRGPRGEVGLPGHTGATGLMVPMHAQNPKVVNIHAVGGDPPTSYMAYMCLVPITKSGDLVGVELFNGTASDEAMTHVCALDVGKADPDRFTPLAEASVVAGATEEFQFIAFPSRPQVVSGQLLLLGVFSTDAIATIGAGSSFPSTSAAELQEGALAGYPSSLGTVKLAATATLTEAQFSALAPEDLEASAVAVMLLGRVE